MNDEHFNKRFHIFAASLGISCHFYRLCTIGISNPVIIWSRECYVYSKVVLIYQANKYRWNYTILEMSLCTINGFKEQYHFHFQPFPKPLSFRSPFPDICFVKPLLTTWSKGTPSSGRVFLLLCLIWGQISHRINIY